MSIASNATCSARLQLSHNSQVIIAGGLTEVSQPSKSKHLGPSVGVTGRPRTGQASLGSPGVYTGTASSEPQTTLTHDSMNAVYDVYYPYQNGPVGVSTTDGLARTVAAGRRGWPLSTHYGPYGGSLRRLMPSLPCLVMVDASLDTA